MFLHGIQKDFIEKKWIFLKDFVKKYLDTWKNWLRMHIALWQNAIILKLGGLTLIGMMQGGFTLLVILGLEKNPNFFGGENWH